MPHQRWPVFLNIEISRKGHYII